MKFDMEKRARELFKSSWLVPHEKAIPGALQLAREALAAQAEEIAEWCRIREIEESNLYGRDSRAYRLVADYARSLIYKPEPKLTREQELENALRGVLSVTGCRYDAPCLSCEICQANTILGNYK